MSTRPSADNARRPVTIPGVLELKRAGRPIVMVTAYDYPSARAAEAAGVDIVLVGDSGAMTVLGHPSTVAVTVDEMLVLAKAARRGTETPLFVVDLPFGSYEVSDEQAITTAVRFVKEAGADAVKLEGGGPDLGQQGQGDRRRRGAGDGPRRPHPADRHRTRRLPRPGPQRRIGAEDRPGCAGSAGGRAASASCSRPCPAC